MSVPLMEWEGFPLPIPPSRPSLVFERLTSHVGGSTLGITTIDKEVTSDKQERLGFLGDSPLVPPLLTLAVGLVLFSLFVPHFATMRTMSGFVSAASINAIVVIGVTLLMIAGEFDLSVGAIVAMGGYIFASIMLDGGSPIVAVGLALLVAG